MTHEEMQQAARDVLVLTLFDGTLTTGVSYEENPVAGVFASIVADLVRNMKDNGAAVIGLNDNPESLASAFWQMVDERINELAEA